MDGEHGERGQLRVWPHTIQDGARRSGSRKNGRKKEITKVLRTLVKGIMRSDGTLGINDRKREQLAPHSCPG